MEEKISKSFLLATDYNQKLDPTGMWMTEKFDGIRALWDGDKFYSRLGKVIRAPSFFTENLPKEKLDGELW